MKSSIARDEMEEFFAENGTEAITAMTGLITAQQNIALGLTKLILEHCLKDEQITKEDVFDIYEESCELLKGQVE